MPLIKGLSSVRTRRSVVERRMILPEQTNPKLKELRVFVQFSKEELEKRRYLLPPATITKTYAEKGNASGTVFHVLHLDGEISLTRKGDPTSTDTLLRRRWIWARSRSGAVESLLEGSAPSKRVEVLLYVKPENYGPDSDTLDIDHDILEICPGVIALMPDEKRGRATKVTDPNSQGRMLTIAVDNSEWLDLDPRVQLNTVLEIQLWISPNQLLKHWGSISPIKERQHLAIDVPGFMPDRKLTQLKQDTNLYYFSGIARRVVSRKYFDPRWKKDKEHREVLLDCGLPLVFEEIADPSEASIYARGEGETFMGLCFLFGSISFSGTRFRTSLVVKVLGISEMDFVPPFVLLDVELMPPSAKPEIRISYHSREQESIRGIELSGYVPPE